MAKTYLDDNGYYRFANSHKVVHRWVAEKYILGRKLKPGEVVHHIDRNKRNNSASNLRVYKSQPAHEFQHMFDGLLYGSYASNTKKVGIRDIQVIWDLFS